jgi:2Fe-2S ferredoxin
MPSVTFIEHDGTEYRVQGEVGKSLMQIAVDHGVPGILADCGGSVSCGTCHGYVETNWSERVPPPTEQEISLLDGLVDPHANSRLTCQITATDELDGIVIRLPASQF